MPWLATVLVVLVTLSGLAVARLHRRLKATRAVNRDLQARLASAVQAQKHARKRARALAVMAKSTKAMRNEFLSNIGHEVRTPMNTIMGMTELALSTDLTERQRHYLEYVRGGAHSLMGLLNDRLDLAKIHANRLELRPTEFRLRDCLGDVVGKFRCRARQKGLRLVHEIEPDVPDALVGDPGRLRQLVGTLLSNAIKFSERGEVRVHAEVDRRQKASVQLHVAVADRGTGIPPEAMCQIFEAFKQADGSKTRACGGCGLGLAIASELVPLMGGYIWVESEVGEGSVFHFTACFGLQERAARPRPLYDSGHLRGLRVLLLSDEPHRCDLIEQWLVELGMEAVRAEDADAAVRILSEADRCGRPFPFVVLNALACVNDGVIRARDILQHSKPGTTQLIMITSAGERGDATACEAAGVTAYLTEPVSRSQLVQSLVLALETRGSVEAVPLITSHTLRERRESGLTGVRDGEKAEAAAPS